jgi:hypothetical protein
VAQATTSSPYLFDRAETLLHVNSLCRLPPSHEKSLRAWLTSPRTHATTTLLTCSLLHLLFPSTSAPNPSVPPCLAPPASPSFLLLPHETERTTGATSQRQPWCRRSGLSLADPRLPEDAHRRPLHPPQRNRVVSAPINVKLAISFSDRPHSGVDSGHLRPSPNVLSLSSGSW